MKIKKTIPIKADEIISYQTDEYSIVFFVKSSGHTFIVTIDSETLMITNNFSINTEINEHYKPCIDNSCIYFSTKFGQILAIDKFSGQILTTMNPAMPIVGDLQQDEKNIYCICGVPISRKWKLITDYYCSCIYDKNTGNKKVQTNYFTSRPQGIIEHKSNFWITSETYIYKYKKDGNLNKKAKLSVPTDYNPVLSNHYIILCYANGIIRVINQDDLSLYSIFRTQKDISQPILLNKNKLICFTQDSLCEIDYEKQQVKELKSSKKMISNPIAGGKKEEIFGCDTNGHLVSFHLKLNKINSIKLSNEPLKQPVSIENQIFVASTNELHLIEI